MKEQHEKYMRIAIEEAKKGLQHDDLMVGVIIVKDGVIIGRGEPRVMLEGDPTAHAELTAIKEACRKIGRPYLAGATMYDTFEPCAMCCGAIMNSGIDTLVIGGRYEGPDRTYGQYSVRRLLELTDAIGRIKLIEDILPEECNTLMPVEKRREWGRRLGEAWFRGIQDSDS